MARQHHLQERRTTGDQELELPERIGRAKLVQVVDHEHDALLEQGQLRYQALDDCVTVKRRRRLQRANELPYTGRGA